MIQLEQQHKKQCAKCRLWLPYSNFSVGRKNKDGLQSWCKGCDAKRSKEFDTPERNRSKWLRRKYGITTTQYEHLLAVQNGVCAICKSSECQIDWQTGVAKSLAVDHDHKTGEVRALLCYACNTSLGLMNENIEHISALLEYAKWCQARELSPKIVQLPMTEMR